MPHWPWRLELERAGHQLVGLAARSATSRRLRRSTWPSRVCSSGLGSNRSIWLGPPFCISMITALARGGEVPGPRPQIDTRPCATACRPPAAPRPPAGAASASVPNPSVACSQELSPAGAAERRVRQRSFGIQETRWCSTASGTAGPAPCAAASASCAGRERHWSACSASSSAAGRLVRRRWRRRASAMAKRRSIRLVRPSARAVRFDATGEAARPVRRRNASLSITSDCSGTADASRSGQLVATTG